VIVQPSPVHCGLCDDPAAELEKLERALVLMPAATEKTKGCKLLFSNGTWVYDPRTNNASDEEILTSCQ
jgi:hypothetical protein